MGETVKIRSVNVWGCGFGWETGHGNGWRGGGEVSGDGIAAAGNSQVAGWGGSRKQMMKGMLMCQLESKQTARAGLKWRQ